MQSFEPFIPTITRLRAALLAQNTWLYTAESCTGGLLGAALTAVPGISQVYAGGVVAYHNVFKTTLLGVSETLIAVHGAVSREVAEAMAQGILACAPCLPGWGIAITGVAGPDGGTPEKPVGTVCFGFAYRGETTSVHSARQHFSGTRHAIREASVFYALNTLSALLMTTTGSSNG